MAADSHGEALVAQVIDRVSGNPQLLSDHYHQHVLRRPKPLPATVLDTLTFPSGKPLPPSLRRWLAFDASWLAGLGWFDPLRTALTPRPLGQIAEAEYGAVFASYGEDAPEDYRFDPISLWHRTDRYFPECFLLPDGSDSRRVFAVTEPDAHGEYPVLVTDIDDEMYLAVMYPGFDVYLAERTGVVDAGHRDTYTNLARHPVYRERMAAHAAGAPFDGSTSGLDLMELTDP